MPDMPEIDTAIQKEAIKEAIREWLNDQFAEFGKWTLRSLLALALGGIVYVIMIGQGWHK